MRSECYFCHIKTIEKLIRKFNPPEEIAEEFIFAVHDLISSNKDLINPKLATHIHRIAMEKFNCEDLYTSEKLNVNRALLNDYEFWKQKVTHSQEPFSTAAKLAVIGNIIDYGAHSLNGDLQEQINDLYSNSLEIDMTQELKEEVSKAKSILYLGDNAGEIVFDRLFIETLNHDNVTYATRGKPIINDVTTIDTEQVGINLLCNIITNGNDAPSTLLDDCSDEFLNKFNSADLIISKGQGNFEGLMDINQQNIFFMLIAKCDPMAKMLGVQKNDMVVTHRKNMDNGV